MCDVTLRDMVGMRVCASVCVCVSVCVHARTSLEYNMDENGFNKLDSFGRTIVSSVTKDWESEISEFPTYNQVCPKQTKRMLQ